MGKAIITIKGKEYRLRFTIGFWKEIKDKCGLVYEEIEKKLSEDFGNVASEMIFLGVKYGGDLKEENEITYQDIENNLDRSAIDVIEQAIIDGMSASEKEILELAKQKRNNDLKQLVDDGKKK